MTYYIEEASTAVGTLQLEYSHDGGARYVVEDSNTGKITHSVTASGLTVLNTIKNESPKNKLYRWRCTSYTSGTLTPTLFKHVMPSLVIDASNRVVVLVDDDAPVNGLDGDGVSMAGKNSLYIDTSADGLIYRNEGSATMVDWVSIQG